MSSIKLFNDKKNSSEWNEEEEQWYFSIQDVVDVLIDSTDIKQYIKLIHQRDMALNSN